MKKKLLLLFVCLLSSSVSGQTSKFFEQVVSHLDCRNCYFIPVNIKSESFSGRVVVENDALFDYLKVTRGFNERAYKEFMIDLLQGNRDLVVKEAAVDDSGFFLVGENLEKHSFRIVEASQAFEIVAAQGCEHLIRNYFSPRLVESQEQKKSTCKERVKRNEKDLLFRPKYDLMEQNNVIANLFEMEIPIYLDDISGSLKIGYLTLK